MKKNLIFSFGNILVNTLYPLLVFPYIARVFSVSSIGTYNYYNIIFSYISLIAAFGMSLYASREIGKSKDTESLKNKVVSELLILSIFNMIVSILLIVIPFIFFTVESDRTIAIIFSLMIIANAISVEWYFVAIEKQKYIFFRNLCFKIISLFLIFFLVKRDSDLLLYSFIVVLGLLLNGIINFINLIIKIRKDFVFTFKFKHYGGLLIIFLVEITFRYFGMGDVALIERFISREELGLLTFSLSIFNIVASFLKIIATTLLPRVSFLLSSNDMNSYYSLLKKSFSLIFFLSFPAILCLYYGSEFLVIKFGGEKYLQSVKYLKLFCPLIISSAIVNTVVFQILYPMGRSRSIISSYIAGIIVNILINLFLVKIFFGASLIISSICSNVLIITMLFLIERDKFPIKKIFSNDVIKYFISFIFAFIYVSLSSMWRVDIYNLFGLAVGLIIYGIILIATKDSLLFSFLATIKFRKNGN